MNLPPHVAVSPEYEIASEVECCGYIVHINVIFLAPTPIIVSSPVVRERGDMGMRRNKPEKTRSF